MRLKGNKAIVVFRNVTGSYFHGSFLGVVQLLNKLDGTSFNRNDQNLFEVCLSLNRYRKIATYSYVDFAKFWRDFQASKFAVVVYCCNV